MAITQSSLTTGSSSTDTTSYTTASISPTANRLVLVAVGYGFDAPAPTLSGASMTWVLVDAYVGGGGMHCAVFRGMSASPGSGALTIDFGATTLEFCAWSIDEFAGIDTSGTNGSGAIVQSVDDGFTLAGFKAGLTITLAAFGNAANATYGAVQYSQAVTITAGSGFTEIFQVTIPTDNRTFQNQWKDTNDTTVDWTWPNIENADAGGVALEIKAESVGVGTIGWKTLLGVGQG